MVSGLSVLINLISGDCIKRDGAPEEFTAEKIWARLRLGLVSSLWSAQVRYWPLLWSNHSREIKKNSGLDNVYLEMHISSYSSCSHKKTVMLQIWKSKSSLPTFFLSDFIYSRCISLTLQDWNLPEMNVNLQLISAVWNIMFSLPFIWSSNASSVVHMSSLWKH